MRTLNLAAWFQVRHYAGLVGLPFEILTSVDGNYSLAHTILLSPSPGCVSKENHSIQKTIMLLKCIHCKFSTS